MQEAGEQSGRHSQGAPPCIAARFPGDAGLPASRTHLSCYLALTLRNVLEPSPGATSRLHCQDIRLRHRTVQQQPRWPALRHFPGGDSWSFQQAHEGQEAWTTTSSKDKELEPQRSPWNRLGRLGVRENLATVVSMRQAKSGWQIF